MVTWKAQHWYRRQEQRGVLHTKQRARYPRHTWKNAVRKPAKGTLAGITDLNYASYRLVSFPAVIRRVKLVTEKKTLVNLLDEGLSYKLESGVWCLTVIRSPIEGTHFEILAVFHELISVTTSSKNCFLSLPPHSVFPSALSFNTIVICLRRLIN